MRSIFDLTDKEIEKYKETPLEVYEKLDMIYFKIDVSEDGWSVFNSKGREIGDVDIIVNSIYGDIVDFASYAVKRMFDVFGKMKIGFFYLPVQKTRTITYEMNAECFILSDYYTADKTKRDDSKLISMLSESLKGRHVILTGSYGKIGPYISSVTLGNWFERGMGSIECASRIMRDMGVHETFSGNELTDIEGFVLRDGSKAYEVAINDTKSYIEPSSKLIYRDTFLESFIHTLQKGTREMILLSKKDYVGKICDLFIEYMNKTDLFNTMWFEEEDLLPPIEGYIGDVTYSMLPPIVSVICKKNPVYKNALRTLLVTFNSNVYSNKFKRFKPEERAVLMEILVKSHLSEIRNK